MIVNDFSVCIAGEAGMGILSCGDSLGLPFSRGGLNVFANTEYESLIRGGHSFYNIRVSKNPYASYSPAISLLIAFDKQSIDLHERELSPHGAVLFDEETLQFDLQKSQKNTFFSVPFKKLAVSAGALPIMSNMTALGAAIGLLQYDIHIFLHVIEEQFQKKGNDIIEKNKSAALAGYEYVKENYAGKFKYKAVKRDSHGKQMFLDGNDALNMGAVKAGLKFVAEYPMTPSSSILHFMAKHARDHKIVVVHTEDELAAINMVIGAGYAGVRSMTATSGGGFSLMAEAIGLAGMIEAPIVIVNVQRPGPSTGLPTRTEQGDLRFVLHASQGDFPRIVLAPGDIEQCFYLTFEAFNLAEIYQCPVIILSDKYLAESKVTCPLFQDKDLKINRGKLLRQDELDHLKAFKRFEYTDGGTSHRSVPGMKNSVYRVSSDEHNETGVVCEEPANRTTMMNKRMRKLETALRFIKPPALIGDPRADITYIFWGSIKGPILESVDLLANKGISANYLQIIYMSPFHSDAVGDILSRVKKKVLVEQNYTAQLGGLIREKTGILMDHQILHYSGRPISAQEIVARTLTIIQNSNIKI